MNATTVSLIETGVIAAAAIAGLIISTLLWCSTKKSVGITEKIFDAGHRPFLAVQDISLEKQEQTKTLSVLVSVINQGGAPARGICNHAVGMFGDVKLEPKGAPTAYLLNPESSREFRLRFERLGQKYYETLGGTSQLRFEMNLGYKGISEKNYRYTANYHYNDKTGAFLLVREDGN